MMQQKKILLLTYNKTPSSSFSSVDPAPGYKKKQSKSSARNFTMSLSTLAFLIFLVCSKVRAQSLLLRLIKESQCQRCKLSTNSPFLFTCVKMKKCTFAPHKNLLTRTSPHQSLSSTICHVYLLFLSRNKEKKSRSPNRWKISFSHSLGLAQFLTCPHLFRVY